MEKLKSQVSVTFWFWLMYLPPEIEIGLNMNAIEQNNFRRGQQVHFTIYSPPFQYHYLILCLNRKLVNFNFKWIWIDGLKPHPPLLSSQKIKCLFLDYVQLLMIGWAGQWTQTPSTTPLQPKKLKCSFLDYVQLLMIGWAGQWTKTPSATPLQPKK